MRRIKSFTLRADGRWHPIVLNGAVLAVESRVSGVIVLWAMHHDEAKDPAQKKSARPYKYQFRAFATDAELPADAVHYVGTVWPPGTPVAWHIFRRD